MTFTFAPNPGEPPRPLARIASGGEASRLSLALKVVLAAADDTPLLVFDEVDAGIGGRHATALGERLRSLAAYHQVLCVTHLPQVAAFADAHLHVGKRVTEGRTQTDLRVLEGAGTCDGARGNARRCRRRRGSARRRRGTAARGDRLTGSWPTSPPRSTHSCSSCAWSAASSPLTIAAYRRDLGQFSASAGGDAGAAIPRRRVTSHRAAS